MLYIALPPAPGSAAAPVVEDLDGPWGRKPCAALQEEGTMFSGTGSGRH